MSNKVQASPSLISGRELRRARNVVKKWELDTSFIDGVWHEPEGDAIRLKRYERACALILADKLRNS